MKVSLTVLVPGPMEGKAIPITIPRFVIGRAPECNLQPGNPTISATHCAVEIGADEVLIRDLGSATGTFVNDRRIKGALQLMHGDRLKVGPLLFGVVIEAAKEPSAAPKPAPTVVKRAADTAEMPLPPETAEMNVGTQDTSVDTEPRTGTPGPKTPTKKEPKTEDKPSSETASVAAKELLRRYLRRRRSDEPLV